MMIICVMGKWGFYLSFSFNLTKFIVFENEEEKAIEEQLSGGYWGWVFNEYTFFCFSACKSFSALLQNDAHLANG